MNDEAVIFGVSLLSRGRVQEQKSPGVSLAFNLSAHQCAAWGAAGLGSYSHPVKSNSPLQPRTRFGGGVRLLSPALSIQATVMVMVVRRVVWGYGSAVGSPGSAPHAHSAGASRCCSGAAAGGFTYSR